MIGFLIGAPAVILAVYTSLSAWIAENPELWQKMLEASAAAGL